MLLDDDDDIQGNQGMNNNNYTPGTGDVHNQGGNNNSLDGGTMDMDMEVMMQNTWDNCVTSAQNKANQKWIINKQK